MKKRISELYSNFMTWSHNLARKTVYKVLSDKLVTQIEFFIFMKRILNLKDPRSLSEKLQQIKLNGVLENYSKFVDKYDVRDFVIQTIGETYLVPIFGVWKDVKSIDFTKLPQKFVLKATHGQGYNFICQDKSTLDYTKIKEKLDSWLNEDFYLKAREIQYKKCEPKIIAEAYLEDHTGGLVDYKFYCFHGQPKLILVITDRFTDYKGNYYFLDLNWNLLPIYYKGYRPKAPFTLEKPKNLSEMLNIVTKLSAKFPFVRVDIYSVNDKLYFGELTFTPSNGLDRYEPDEIDQTLGSMLDLKFYFNEDSANKNPVSAVPSSQDNPIPFNPSFEK